MAASLARVFGERTIAVPYRLDDDQQIAELAQAFEPESDDVFLQERRLGIEMALQLESLLKRLQLD
jgi:hypothetical protein